MEDKSTSISGDKNLIGSPAVSHPEIETKKGNYLLLTPPEAEAIKQYVGSGNVYMNMLFNTDIDSILPRLQHWARADENIEKFLCDDVVYNIINLYGALLKSYDYHRSSVDTQEHPHFIYRGSTGNHHSDGFKSFTVDQAMAQSFGDTIFGVVFPDDIPYLSSEDIYNYAPHTSRREESEFLFSPFCEIIPFYSKGSFLGRPRGYILSKREFHYSTDNFPASIDENLFNMAKLIQEYRDNARIIENFERRQLFGSDYQNALLLQQELRKSYKNASEAILNYIEYQCAQLDNAHHNRLNNSIA